MTSKLFIDIFRKLIFIYNLDKISDIINLAFKKDLVGYYTQLVGYYNDILIIDYIVKIDTYSLLNYCIFLVKNVNVLVENLRKKGLNVNRDLNLKELI